MRESSRCTSPQVLYLLTLNDRSSGYLPRSHKLQALFPYLGVFCMLVRSASLVRVFRLYLVCPPMLARRRRLSCIQGFRAALEMKGRRFGRSGGLKKQDWLMTLPYRYCRSVVFVIVIQRSVDDYYSRHKIERDGEKWGKLIRCTTWKWYGKRQPIFKYFIFKLYKVMLSDFVGIRARRPDFAKFL